MTSVVKRPRSYQGIVPVLDGDFTVVLYLSGPDEYDGGDLFFPHLEISLRPSIGSMVAFPASAGLAF